MDAQHLFELQKAAALLTQTLDAAELPPDSNNIDTYSIEAFMDFTFIATTAISLHEHIDSFMNRTSNFLKSQRFSRENNEGEAKNSNTKIQS